jgi:peroxiredoxin
MRRVFAAVSLFVLAIGAQQQPASKDQLKAIEQQIRSLRSLPDDVRAVTTLQLAVQIRGLSSAADKLSLALGLSNLSTEGDFGRATLQQVANTLAQAIRESRPKEDAYAELARLVHYEHLDAPLEDPKFAAAMAQLDADDRVRQEADFTLEDLQGTEWTLKQLRGNVVLVNFWATWCPPCRKEMPDLEKLYNQFSKRGLIILAISDEEATKVKPFVAAGKYTYPILLDPGRAVNDHFRIQGIPKTLVYDRNANLVAQSADMRTMGQFREMLNHAGLQ